MITQRCCTWSSVARGSPERHTGFPNRGRGAVQIHLPRLLMGAELAHTGAGGPTTGDTTIFQLTVLYNHPEDTSTFDRHYDEVHVPLAEKMPGLRRFTLSRPG